ncbi:MAG: uridine kinase family protein [Luteibaculaceae bacterium]
MHVSKKPYLVGISGGSGSGKTTFIKALQQAMPQNSLALVSQDNYYHPRHKQPKDSEGRINFDLPSSINHVDFIADMKCLAEGKTIQKLEYTFNNPNKAPEFIEVQPAPIIVMEGLFIFHFEEIKDQLDLKIYIDVKEEIKLNRRIMRDAKERGYPEDSVRYQWNNHVMPSYKQFLYPYKSEMDIVIPNNRKFDLGLEIVVNYLKTKI